MWPRVSGWAESVPSVSPARRVAFEILLKVEGGSVHSGDLLQGKRVDALPVADRNLATALVLGVLRWKIQLNKRIGEFLDRPKARLDREVQIALQLGAFQLLYLDRVPAHAAIDESVELAKGAGYQFAARMVNAVLRKLAGAGSRAEGAQLESSAVEAYPAWMVDRWREFFGVEATRSICVHGQQQPAPTIRIDAQDVEEELVRAGISFEPGILLGPARRVTRGDVTRTAAFDAGRVRMQDEGSQLVAEVAHASAADQGPNSILDLCAAPAGKTLILAERNPQARIEACEASAKRLAAMRSRLARFGERIRCRLMDGATLNEDSVFDLVLADVPCSGTGTLGRNPEIRHRLHRDDLRRQAERQRALLDAALRAVKAGGRVVYSTCSLEPEENEEVVATVLSKSSGTRLVPVDKVIEALAARGILHDSGAKALSKCVTGDGSLRLLPGALGTDGFFIAVIEKRS
jgi:16S rRNA (cytosine967-C5)-methyltransferase